MDEYGVPVISNQSPESGIGADLFVSDDVGDHGVIVERFRKLKAAATRAATRARPTLRHPILGSTERGGSSTEPVYDGNGGSWGTESGGEGRKRQSSVLVAMALDKEPGVKKTRVGCGSFYDCGICWCIAREPIVTCCGHLFCWGCFFKLPYMMYPTMERAKECPVCEGEVSEANIVPIYGDADSTADPKPDVDSGLRDPPRPKARRVESSSSRQRQAPVARGLSQIPVTEALRRIRTSISVMGQAVAADFSSSAPTAAMFLGEDLPMPRSTRFSRVISDSAASLSYISSALNNAQRLVEDLETYRRLQTSVAQLVADDYGDTISRNATVTVLFQQQGSSEEIISDNPSPPLEPTDIDPHSSDPSPPLDPTDLDPHGNDPSPS